MSDVGRAVAFAARLYRQRTAVACSGYVRRDPMALLNLRFGVRLDDGGEAGDFVAEGNLRWGSGSLPTNTSGGGLSEAYVHGFNLITEGVRQVRGTSTCQVEGATNCLVTSGEGVPTSAILLRAG